MRAIAMKVGAANQKFAAEKLPQGRAGSPLLAAAFTALVTASEHSKQPNASPRRPLAPIGGEGKGEGARIPKSISTNMKTKLLPALALSSLLCTSGCATNPQRPPTATEQQFFNITTNFVTEVRWQTNSVLKSNASSAWNRSRTEIFHALKLQRHIP
jgi:hypothetical protein